jgi:hypothetical protein
MCNQQNGATGGTGCFYKSASNSTTVTYLFCNYTIFNCASCPNSTTCSTCNQGFYGYNYNLLNLLTNCQSCAIIPGCLYCSSQSQCTQCLPGFKSSSIQGCTYLNGTMPNEIELFVYHGGASTAA